MPSKELQAIIAARETARAQGRRVALVTVVRTSGSTYRRPGAHMLVVETEPDGAEGENETGFSGSISGGCLEDDAREHALRAIREERPALIRYDTTSESDILLGTGAGCQGIVEVFIEPLPISDASADPLEPVAAALREGRSGVLATVIAADSPSFRMAVGSFLWVDFPESSHSVIRTTTNDQEWSARLAADARAAAFHQRTETRSYPQEGGLVEVFYEIVQPPRALLICGAGQDAIPLARLSKELGWRVRVVDGRRAYVTRKRFPDADEIIHCPASEFGARVQVEAGEAAVTMTHNYLHDRDILRALLLSPAAYIGLLGPRARTERLLADLATPDDIAPPVDLGKYSLSRLHAPAGLDIGAQAPEQIALSIVAEIEAAASGRDGRMLKRRLAPLHDAYEDEAGRPRGVGNTPAHGR